MFSKRPLYYKHQYIPSAKISGNLRQEKVKDISLLQFFNKSRSLDEQFAQYHRMLAFKSPVIPVRNWPDVVMAVDPLGKIIAMSVKNGVPLYKGKRENYLGRSILEVFDRRSGPGLKMFCQWVWENREMASVTVGIKKGEKLFEKKFWFFPLQDLIIVCAKHFSVIDTSHPIPG